MSNSGTITYSVEQLTRRLREVEMEIESWGSRNSQSNPGAVMELRDMRKQRDTLSRALAIGQYEAKKSKDAAEAEVADMKVATAASIATLDRLAMNTISKR